MPGPALLLFMLLFWLPAVALYLVLPLVQLIKFEKGKRRSRGVIFALVGYSIPVLLIYAMGWSVEYLGVNWAVMVLAAPIAFGLSALVIYQVAIGSKTAQSR